VAARSCHAASRKRDTKQVSNPQAARKMTVNDAAGEAASKQELKKTANTK
jgi:hypothetical protein